MSEEPTPLENVFYLEEQKHGSQMFFNGYFEYIRTYASLEAAKEHLAPSVIGEPYEDIGGFTMREVKDA